MNSADIQPAIAAGTAASRVASQAGLLAMATAGGIAVANIYYNQPMLGLIEAEFGGGSVSGFVPVATQLGYAAGLLLLLPLGDLVERRRLIVGQFVILSVALVFAALAPSAWMLVLASLVLGASATVAQQIVPFAAALVTPEKRGSAIGTVMAGVLSGILFSRTLSGLVGDHAGWRVMFWLGVPLALVAAALMAAVLPRRPSVSQLSYRVALVSLLHLWRRYPALRIATMVQAMLFASFTAFWTILAFYLAGPDFGMGADVAGLFGLVGAAGVAAAPLAGRVADRRGPHFVIRAGIALTFLAWVIVGTGGSVAWLVAGVLVLDFGIQGALVSNQHVIYALDADARGRLNTVFMTGMFLGGAAGSALAAAAWTAGGWWAVSLLGATLAVVAAGVLVVGRATSSAGKGR